MINIKKFKENPLQIINALNTRGADFSYLNDLIDLDRKRIEIIKIVEEKKAFRNSKSKKIGKLKYIGENTETVLAEVADIGDEITRLDSEKNAIEAKIRDILLKTPNVPRETCPTGIDENENVELRKWGKPRKFSFKPKDHAEVATKLDIISFKQSSKITGARFAVFKGKGAKLHRALAQFLLDRQTKQNGFLEVLTPYMVNQNTIENTGQLPKFEEDLFKLNNGYYLIPTAEVPVTNLHKNNVIDVSKTIKYCSYSPCFRVEAGSAGKDVKGIIRQHQFHKVEMVMFAKSEKSLEELEIMTEYAEKLLQELELPYRVIELCTGDLGFSSSKTYDIEVWFPSYNTYKEISSCSNMSDFQSRRANIKYKNKNEKLELVHTLNGSGLPIERSLAAIIENYQQDDGSLVVPKVLIPYMGTDIIK